MEAYFLSTDSYFQNCVHAFYSYEAFYKEDFNALEDTNSFGTNLKSVFWD